MLGSDPDKAHLKHTFETANKVLYTSQQCNHWRAQDFHACFQGGGGGVVPIASARIQYSGVRFTCPHCCGSGFGRIRNNLPDLGLALSFYRKFKIVIRNF